MTQDANGVNVDTRYGNFPKREPDLKGTGGEAWRIGPNVEGEHAGIGADWLVHAPDAHPFWCWYAISAIHLRPLPTKGPANIMFDGATHEIVFLSLHPERPLPHLDAWGKDIPMVFLTPPDVACQFTVNSDSEAKDILDSLIGMIVIDGMSPDEDLRQAWEEIIRGKAAQRRGESHGA